LRSATRSARRHAVTQHTSLGTNTQAGWLERPGTPGAPAPLLVALDEVVKIIRWQRASEEESLSLVAPHRATQLGLRFGLDPSPMVWGPLLFATAITACATEVFRALADATHEGPSMCARELCPRAPDRQPKPANVSQPEMGKPLGTSATYRRRRDRPQLRRPMLYSTELQAHL